MFKTYTIMVNDTIEEIANKFGTTTEEIIRINRLAPNQPLVPYSAILVPEANTNQDFALYTVKHGDHIYGIARTNNIPYHELLRLNGLGEHSLIYPGQQIRIPNYQDKFYISKERDTINGIANTLGLTVEQLINQNTEVYLMPNQTLKYK